MESGTRQPSASFSPGLPAAIQSIAEACTGDAVFVVGPDYRIAYWDPRAEDLTGKLADEVLGESCFDVVLGEREDGGPFCTHGCWVMHMARAGRPVSSYDMRILTGSGEKRWVGVSTLSVVEDGEPYLIHLLRDAQGAHDTLEMAQALIQLGKKGQPAPTPSTPTRKHAPSITPRQLEVLRALAEGKTTRDIGREFYLSEATVRNHIRGLLQAFGAHSQLEALARAREMGFLP